MKKEYEATNYESDLTDEQGEAIKKFFLDQNELRGDINTVADIVRQKKKKELTRHEKIKVCFLSLYF